MKQFNIPKPLVSKRRSPKVPKNESMYSLLETKRLEKVIDKFRVNLVLDEDTKSVDIIYTEGIEVTVNGYDPQILADLRSVFMRWFSRELEINKSVSYYLSKEDRPLKEIEKLVNRKILEYEKTYHVRVRNIMKGCMCIEPHFSRLPEELLEKVNYVRKMRRIDNQEAN